MTHRPCHDDVHTAHRTVTWTEHAQSLPVKHRLALQGFQEYLLAFLCELCMFSNNYQQRRPTAPCVSLSRASRFLATSMHS